MEGLSEEEAYQKEDDQAAEGFHRISPKMIIRLFPSQRFSGFFGIISPLSRQVDVYSTYAGHRS
jgi:hypothetical protein